jgi:hypothetical protein
MLTFCYMMNEIVEPTGNMAIASDLTVQILQLSSTFFLSVYHLFC